MGDQLKAQVASTALAAVEGIFNDPLRWPDVETVRVGPRTLRIKVWPNPRAVGQGGPRYFVVNVREEL